MFNFRWSCGQCGHAMVIPTLFDTSYGCFVLASKAGKFGFLSAIEDPVFDEMFGVARRVGKRLGRDVSVDECQHMFGPVTCDAAVGDPLYIGRRTCDLCGGGLESHAAHENSVNVPDVTHTRWNALNAMQKEHAVAAALTTRP